MKLKPSIVTYSIFAAALSMLIDPGHVYSMPQDEMQASADDTTSNDTISFHDEDFTELDELVVVERQKLVKSDGATLTYNVSEDPEAASSNTLDILRKVPGVTVDAEDNVKVNGQSSFKVLLNGREDPMVKGDLKTVLKSLPAATIKKIEVISEPGSKYDAEGIGGILNIVTDRSKNLSGFMTQLGAWVNAYQAGGYVNARTRLNKVMLDANVSYNNGKIWPRSQSSERIIESLDGSENHLMTARQKAKNGWDYTGINMNMSWEPDTLNLFTLSANYGYNTWGNNGTEDRDMKRPDMSTMWNIHRDFNTTGKYNGTGVQLSYQHNFRRPDHNIVTSYQYYYTDQNDITNYFLEYLSGEGSEYPFSSDRNNIKRNYHIVQLDYSNRFNNHHLLEAGGKIFLNDNSNLVRPFFGPSEEEAVEADGMVVKMDRMMNVYALYGSYTGSFSKWNVKAGVRYEHTEMGGKYRIGDYPDFTTLLNDIVPNAAVSYNISDASSLRLAYQMRITRPDVSQLNPYVNTLTPGQIQYGNPDLKSEKGHTFTLGYSNYEGKFSGSAKLSYRYVSNSVNDVIFMRDGIMNSTYANIGESHMAMLELSGDWNITPALRWSLYVSGNYQHLQADSELLKAKNHGWQTNINTNLNYSVAQKWRLSAYGGLWTPWIDLQSSGTTTGYYYGLGAGRSWLKDDALTVQLSAGNMFPTHGHNSFRQEDESVRRIYTGRYSQWNVGLSVTFKFGGLQATVKKTAANIEKEETTSSESRGGNK
ncbi:MAG: TonB-dependent receptor [Muribaculaceae bacterium]|nr:TonB-dependent receptor [Muribaculaceae bacterium]